MALQRLNPPSLISARQAERGGHRITFSVFQETNVECLDTTPVLFTELLFLTD